MIRMWRLLALTIVLASSLLHSGGVVVADRDTLTGISFTFPSELRIQKEAELCIRFENMDRADEHLNLTILTEPFELIKPMDFQVFAKTKLACFDIKLDCSSKLITNDVSSFRLKVVAHVGLDKHCFEKDIKIKESGKARCLEKLRRSLMAIPDPDMLSFFLQYISSNQPALPNFLKSAKPIETPLELPETETTTVASPEPEEPAFESQEVSGPSETTLEAELNGFEASETFENLQDTKIGDETNETAIQMSNTNTEVATKELENSTDEAYENESSNETRVLLLKTIKPFPKPTVMNAILALSDDYIAIGASDSTIQIWDTKRSVLNKTLVGHGGRVMALCLLPNGNLASGSSDRTIRIWDVSTGEQKMLIKGESGGYVVLQMLDHERLAGGFSDQTIKIWNVTSGEQILKLVGHSRKIYSLTKLDNGDLVSGSADRTIKVWNTTDGTLKRTFSGHTDSVESLCALPGGRFASGSWDATIKLWNSEEGLLEQTLEGHTDSIFSLVLLRNGDLASGSLDKTIKIWSPADGKLKRSIDVHHYGVRRMTLLSSGNLVTIGYTEQKIKMWNATALSEPQRYYLN